MSLLEFIKSITIDSDEIIYFGGSFNPWHEGHSECLKKAPSNALKIVIPDHNPLKVMTDRELILDESQLKSLNKNVFIYLGFFDQKILNPTVDWIRPITQEFKDRSHALLMGYDSYIGLPKWKESEALLSIIDTLYVLNRKNDVQERLYPTDTVFLGSHIHESLSSSAIRKRALTK